MSAKELYDLAGNTGESAYQNLCDSQSGLAKELENTLFKWLRRIDAKMPEAVKVENPQIAIPHWYSQWISDHDPSLNYSDPLQEAIGNASLGDTITLYPGRLNTSIDLSNLPEGVTLQTIPPAQPLRNSEFRLR